MKQFKFYVVLILTVFSIALNTVFTPKTSVAMAEGYTNEIQTKVPIGRKALAMKFVLAMLGVGASSVIIFVGLSAYNRFIYGTVKPKIAKNEDESYQTPNNMKDAIEIFLRKTK